jgi:hypothetical protein
VKKTITIIGVMGVVGMILLCMLGLSFIGRIGGAAGVPALREDLLARHGLVIADEESFAVRVAVLGEGAARKTQMRITFTPVETVARDATRLERYMRRLAGHVLEEPEWAGRLDSVAVVAVRKKDEVHRIYTLEDCAAPDHR